MPEVQHAALAHNHEARAIDDVGISLDQRFQQVRVLARIVLEVGVLDEAELAARLFDGVANSRALSLVSRAADDADNLRVSAGDLLCDFR